MANFRSRWVASALVGQQGAVGPEGGGELRVYAGLIQRSRVKLQTTTMWCALLSRSRVAERGMHFLISIDDLCVSQLQGQHSSTSPRFQFVTKVFILQAVDYLVYHYLPPASRALF